MNTPRWELEAVLRVTDGRTRAPVLRFHDTATGASQDMIVKSIGRHLVERNLFSEYFGNVLAREMGVQTPHPYVIVLDDESVAMMNDDFAIKAAGLTFAPGRVVASEWFRPAVTPGVGSKLSEGQVEEAARIYTYDSIVQNPDRLIKNPNLLEIRGHFVAIDFETAFSFLFDILNPCKPWQISDLPFIKEHVFRSRLAKSSVDWGELTKKMLAIDLYRLGSSVALLPEEWHDDGARVVAHLEALQSHASELAWEILRTLS